MTLLESGSKVTVHGGAAGRAVSHRLSRSNARHITITLNTTQLRLFTKVTIIFKSSMHLMHFLCIMM